jgi:hypothetical protein
VVIQNLSLQVYNFIQTARKLSGILIDHSQEEIIKVYFRIRGRNVTLGGKKKNLSYLVNNFLKHYKPE